MNQMIHADRRHGMIRIPSTVQAGTTVEALADLDSDGSITLETIKAVATWWASPGWAGDQIAALATGAWAEAEELIIQLDRARDENNSTQPPGTDRTAHELLILAVIEWVRENA